MKILLAITLSYLLLVQANASQPLLNSSIEPAGSLLTPISELGHDTEKLVDAKAVSDGSKEAIPIKVATEKNTEHLSIKNSSGVDINPKRLATLVDFCAPCHGKNGISTATIYPHLAGQLEPRIFKQLQEYKLKQRKNIIMQGMVNRLDKQDMLALAQYYANLDGIKKINKVSTINNAQNGVNR